MSEIIEGDSRKVLSDDVEDDSIDCIVTSPPYYRKRSYGEDLEEIWCEDDLCTHSWDDNTCTQCGAWRGQLGLEPRSEMFVDHLLEVLRECINVLKESGSFWLNLGDTYSNVPSGSRGSGWERPTRRESDKGREKTPRDYQYPLKCMFMIPERVAFRLLSEGLILRNKVIWRKTNPMPDSCKDRLTTTYEMLFHFTLAQDYYYDLDPIREPHKQGTLKRAMRGDSDEAKYNQAGYTHDDTSEFKRITEYEGYEGMEEKVDNGEVHLHPKGKNPGDVWEISTAQYSKSHYAVFPEELVERPVQASCPPDGVVLDPFAGRGTVGRVAREYGREYILIDRDTEAIDLAKEYTKHEENQMLEEGW